MINLTLSIQDFEYFLLIFIRLTCFFVTAPFFETKNVPSRFKVGLGFFMAMLIYQFVVPHETVYYNTVIGYAVLVIKEAAVGLMIGFGVNIPMSILTFAGKFIDMDIGLSMVNLYDPTTRINEGFTGMMYHYMILLILIISDMHHYLIRAFIDIFKLVPVGNVVFNVQKLYDAAMMFLVDYIVIGFRICMPIMAAILIVNIILGIMAKTSPQMNMFAVGVQIKIIMGLMILYMISALLPNVSNFIYIEIKKFMVSMVGVIQ